MTTLLEIVADLEPALLDSLDAIRVTLDAPVPSAMVATLSFSLFRQPDQARVIGPEPLPDGVNFSAIERWPDLVKPLDTDPPIERQIRELDASGLVGHLDASRFVADPSDSNYQRAMAQGHAPISYIIKTHAGSAAERHVWAKERGRKPGRPRVYEDARRDLHLQLPDALIARIDAATDNRTAWIEEAIRQRLEHDTFTCDNGNHKEQTT